VVWALHDLEVFINMYDIEVLNGEDFHPRLLKIRTLIGEYGLLYAPFPKGFLIFYPRYVNNAPFPPLSIFVTYPRSSSPSLQLTSSVSAIDVYGSASDKA
jgi:hypothetical protein